MMGMAGTANALLKVLKIAFGVIALMAVALIHAGNATATLYFDGTLTTAAQLAIEGSFLSDLGATGIILDTEGFNVAAGPATTLVFGDVTATSITSIRTVTGVTTEGTHSLAGQGITFSFSSVINAFAIDLLDFGDPLSCDIGGVSAPCILSVSLALFGESLGAPAELFNTTDGKFDDENFLFFGVIDADFTSVSFIHTGGDDGVNYDRLQYDVPEPSTLALFATGLALLGFLGWRRRGAAWVKAA